MCFVVVLDCWFLHSRVVCRDLSCYTSPPPKIRTCNFGFSNNSRWQASRLIRNKKGKKETKQRKQRKPPTLFASKRVLETPRQCCPLATCCCSLRETITWPKVLFPVPSWDGRVLPSNATRAAVASGSAVLPPYGD